MAQPSENISYFSIVNRTCAALGGGALTPVMYAYIGSFTNVIIKNAQVFQNASLPAPEKSKCSKELEEASAEFLLKICGLGLAVLLCSFVENESFNYVRLKQVFRLRLLYFEKILNQDIAWYDTFKANPISSDITENMAKLEEGLGEKVPTFLGYCGMFMVCLIVAFASGWELALVCMISLPACTIAIGLSTWIMSKFVKNELDAYSAAGTIAEEVLSAIKTVVAFEGQKREKERYSKEVRSAHANNRRRALFSSTGQAVVWLLVFSCYGLSFWYGFSLNKRDAFSKAENGYTPGKLLTVFFSAMGASVAFASASPLVETFKLSKVAAGKIFQVFTHQPTINTAKTKGVILESVKGHIVFRNVSFHYPSRPDVKVLDDFNLSINPGQTIALVGNSGSGKSTVAQLLLRFYDPTAGQILIDGVDLKDLNLRWMRSFIGTVWQEPVLFDATIRANILLGNPDASQEDIESATRQADLHDFIETLPEGYDTPVSATRISGGQKQRLAIARALVRKPKILLFDEATSALDTESEAVVQAALEKAGKTCTTIIIAHRLSTIRHTDKIVVIDQGRIAEQGTHSELVALRGHYYKLVTQPQGLHTGTDSSSAIQDKDYSKEDIIQQNELRANEKTNSLEESSSFKKLITINRPEINHIFCGALAAFLNSASLPIYAILFGNIIQAFAMEDLESVSATIDQYCIFFLLLAAFCSITMFLQIYMLQIAGEKLTMRLRVSLFESFLKQEMAWFDESENSVGSLCAILAGETASVQSASGICIGTILNSAGTFLLCIAVAFYYHWKLALVCFTIPVLSLVVVVCEQFISQKNQTLLQESVEKSAKLALEAVSNIRTVASLGCESKFLERYQTELEAAYAGAIKGTFLHSFANSCFKSMPVFTYGLCIYYGVKLTLNEDLPYGIIFNISESVLLASMTIANTLAFTPNVSKALRATKRIFKLINRSPKINQIKESTTNSCPQGDISFSKVHFAYPTRPANPILLDFNLRVLQAKTIALVGPSGCGKSTVIQLLQRFYDPNSGCVLICDQDIRSVDVEALRWQMGVVSQEANLFDRSIAENIAYGDNRRIVGLEEVIEAAKVANIHDFVATLPLGYETRIGEKGTQLSGGQKQRIAIARALIRKPKILLLDEATSALDNENEKIVQEALDKAKAGRTCITIAHRLTTVQDADVICVIHDGKIAEMGCHSSLLGRKGLYFHYFSLQK